MKQTPCCHWSPNSRIILILIALVTVSLASVAQTPILSFAFEDSSLQATAGRAATTRLRVTNDSVYDADDVEILLLSEWAELSPMEPITVVDAFSNVSPSLQIQVPRDAALGANELLFELSYTYCIGELCFQIVDEVALSIEILEAPADPIDETILEPTADVTPDPIVSPDTGSSKARVSPLRWLLPVSLVTVLAVALIASKIVGRAWWITGLLLIALAGGLGYGISLRQDQQAQSIGAVLCTSCVGIEETPHSAPELSVTGRERIEALTTEIELRIFSATWCHACPYAKQLVEQVVGLNPRIVTQVIDVDEDREAADRYGIIQSGRTIVPAILRVDTGEVLFGIEDLEERLIALLEETL